MASQVPRNISRRALTGLHTSMARAAGSFGSYNFREYFLRLADRKFNDELSSIIGQQSYQKLSLQPASKIYTSLASSSSAASSSNSQQQSSPPGEEDTDLLATLPEEQKARLQEWWNKANNDLEVWKRSSIVNNLYAAPRLVVEGEGNLAVEGGGGAGMEASAGGAGQPIEPSVDGHGKDLS
ncbi:hypothetical protein P389DRAFT_30699 [Cystobasidium minutum MCA 4210]|uniref:uncharacterized protein n=1 Tax=Cystobasidium minutum MCA 4210 TaxID=1397322 RepID=UPI0034CF2646|eukprot:jgi/Rhomi1/30699/CE30698_2391